MLDPIVVADNLFFEQSYEGSILLNACFDLVIEMITSPNMIYSKITLFLQIFKDIAEGMF
jgi:hypothetical protein